MSTPEAMQRAVTDAGAQRAYVRRALNLGHKRRPMDTRALLDEVAACGGVVPYAVVLVADGLVLDTLGTLPRAADLSRALALGRELVEAVRPDELAQWLVGCARVPQDMRSGTETEETTGTRGRERRSGTTNPRTGGTK